MMFLLILRIFWRMPMMKKDFKQTIFYSDPIVGDFSIQELIYFLENLLIKNKQLDHKLIEILTDNGFDYNSIQDILRISDTSYHLQFMIDMLNDDL